MRTSALFGEKTSDFSKFMVRPQSVRTRGRGSIFRDFMRTSLIDSPKFEDFMPRVVRDQDLVYFTLPKNCWARVLFSVVVQLDIGECICQV